MEIYSVLGIGELNIAKMTIFPKSIYTFHVILIKNAAGFMLLEIDKMILKFIDKCEAPRIVKTIIKEKNKVDLYHLTLRLIINRCISYSCIIIMPRWTKDQ